MRQMARGIVLQLGQGPQCTVLIDAIGRDRGHHGPINRVAA